MPGITPPQWCRWPALAQPGTPYGSPRASTSSTFSPVASGSLALKKWAEGKINNSACLKAISLMIFRKLVLASMIGVVLTLFVIGTIFVTMDNAHHLSGKGNDCWGTKLTCEGCLKNEECGFCYDNWAYSAIDGTCMQKNGTHGNCNGEFPGDYSWYVCSSNKIPSPNNKCVRYPDYCPTSKAKSWAIIIFLAGYLVSFAAGWQLSRCCHIYLHVSSQASRPCPGPSMPRSTPCGPGLSAPPWPRPQTGQQSASSDDHSHKTLCSGPST